MVDKEKWDKHDKLVDWTHYYNSEERHKHCGELEHEEIIRDETIIRHANLIDSIDGFTYNLVSNIKTKRITCPVCKDVRQITSRYDGPDYYDGLSDEEDRFELISMGGLCPSCVETLEKIRVDEGKEAKWHKYWELPPL